MHIEVHIFPNSFPIDPKSWRMEMLNLGIRIEKVILEATVNAKSASLGKVELFDEESKMLVATIDIRRE